MIELTITVNVVRGNSNAASTLPVLVYKLRRLAAPKVAPLTRDEIQKLSHWIDQGVPE